jgi:hypothetical protein
MLKQNLRQSVYLPAYQAELIRSQIIRRAKLISPATESHERQKGAMVASLLSGILANFKRSF